jgi:hypothetical protein
VSLPVSNREVTFDIWKWIRGYMAASYVPPQPARTRGIVEGVVCFGKFEDPRIGITEKAEIRPENRDCQA